MWLFDGADFAIEKPLLFPVIATSIGKNLSPISRSGLRKGGFVVCGIG